MIGVLKKCAPLGVLTLSALFFVWWFSRFLDYSPVASVDLPGHVALIGRLSTHLMNGRLFFFDPWWFGGWPAYQFYGFFSHLVAAALVPIISLWSESPVVDAVHVVMVTGCATLPISIFLLAKAFRSKKGDEGSTAELVVMAMYSSVFSFWYLNQPLDFFGIGAASLWHGGLFSQVIAWHLCLLFLAALVTSLHRSSLTYGAFCAILFALLIVTHIFAAVFCGFIWGLVFLFFPRRIRTVLLMILALGLSSYWLLPMVATAGEYTIAHREPPRGDYFDIFIKQPYVHFSSGVSLLFEGKAVAVEIVPILALIVTAALFLSRAFWRNRTMLSFVFFVACAVTFFSSVRVYQYLPVALHYYRFIAFILLLVLGMLVTVVPSCLLKGALGRVSHLILLATAVGALAMTATVTQSRGRAISYTEEAQSLNAQNVVLAALTGEAPSHRVAFEYFKDREIFPFLSPHYLESRLFSETGRETTNGLFIQSSLASAFTAHSLKALGLEAYRVPALEENTAKTDRATALEQLRSAGITQVVAASPHAIEQFAAEEKLPIKPLGQYSLISIGAESQTAVRENRKRLVFYYDAVGGVPFKYIEMYFYSNPSLYAKTLLVKLSSPYQDIPPGSTVISHGLFDKADFTFLLPGPGRSTQRLNMFFGEDESYRIVRSALEFLELDKHFTTMGLAALTNQAAPEVSLNFDDQKQTLVVDSMTPGKVYTLPYTYFPYWQVEGGEVLRGIAEQMVVRPDAKRMILRYRRKQDSTVVIASFTCLTSLAIVLLMLLPLRRNEGQFVTPHQV